MEYAEGLIPEENVKLIGRDGVVTISHLILYEFCHSDYIISALKFKYQQEYDKFIETLKEQNMSEEQYKFVLDNCMPKLYYEIDLKEYSIELIDKYRLFLLYDAKFIFNNILEFIECLSFAKFILDNTLYEELCNNQNEKDMIIYILNKTEKKHRIDHLCSSIIYIKQLHYHLYNDIFDYENTQYMFKNYSVNKDDNELIDKLVDIMLNILRDELYWVYRTELEIIKYLNIVYIVKGNIEHFQYIPLYFEKKCEIVEFDIKYLLDYITQIKVNKKLIQDFIIHYYKQRLCSSNITSDTLLGNKINSLKKNELIAYELKLLNETKDKIYVMERLELLNNILNRDILKKFE